MNRTGIAVLRQDAHALLDRAPDDKLAPLMEVMRGLEGLAPKKKRGKNSETFKRLMELRRPVPDLDEEKELAEWREEKFGNGIAD